MSNVPPNDNNPQETKEWLDALENIIEQDGIEIAQFILEKLTSQTQSLGTCLPHKLTTPYLNTISTAQEPTMPGNLTIERKIRSIIRWNAQAMVLRAF